MITWQLFNISHAAYGWNKGSLDSFIVLLLQSIYIFDWAYNERWYLYTVDIQHDRLGFYLTFGSFAWMPIVYTSYGYYASHIPVNKRCALKYGEDWKKYQEKNPYLLVPGVY